MMATTTRSQKIAAAAIPPSAMTTPAQIERLGEHLRKLRLLKSGERLEALLQHAAAQELPYAEFLEQVLGEEVAAKASKNITMRTAMARLPFVKPLETFDFGYQPSIDRKQLQVLANCHFIEHGENVIVLGPPGVGKTHLAVSLGIKAIENGYPVLFTTLETEMGKMRAFLLTTSGELAGTAPESTGSVYPSWYGCRLPINLAALSVGNGSDGFTCPAL